MSSKPEMNICKNILHVPPKASEEKEGEEKSIYCNSLLGEANERLSRAQLPYFILFGMTDSYREHDESGAVIYKASKPVAAVFQLVEQTGEGYLTRAQACDWNIFLSMVQGEVGRTGMEKSGLDKLYVKAPQDSHFISGSTAKIVPQYKPEIGLY